MKVKTQQILDNLNSAGQFSRVSWTRTLKTRKDVPCVCTKQTTCVVRSGIDYANLASVKTGIAAGERNEVQSLPWGEWIKFPLVIGHKGNEYVRLYPTAGNHAETQYFIDSIPASKEDVTLLVLASEVKPSSEVACFAINVENITAVNGVSVINLASLAFKPVATSPVSVVA